MNSPAYSPSLQFYKVRYKFFIQNICDTPLFKYFIPSSPISLFDILKYNFSIFTNFSKANDKFLTP